MAPQIAEAFHEISLIVCFHGADNLPGEEREMSKEGLKVECPPPWRQMVVAASGVVVEMDLAQPGAESFDPVGKRNIGEYLEMPGVKTESKGGDGSCRSSSASEAGSFSKMFSRRIQVEGRRLAWGSRFLHVRRLFLSHASLCSANLRGS